MESTTTTDMARFGNREREMAEELLRAWREQGLPEDFYDDEVVIMCNANSGNVFLTNSNYEAAMMTDDGKLQTWYNCPQCGCEGFREEIGIENHTGKDKKECRAWIRDIKKAIAEVK